VLTSLLIALSLNFDTLSVAIIEGAINKRPRILESLKVALFFGIGQALMAQIGALLGFGFKYIIADIDHWIAFVLLSIIGLKIIFDKDSHSRQLNKNSSVGYKTLTWLTIATSIDSLIIGITLAFIKKSIFSDLIIIGIVSFIVSFIGFHTGGKLKNLFRSKIKIAGGLVLMLIGTKILIEHLFF
jgi:manganese efflux pump family protein